MVKDTGLDLKSAKNYIESLENGLTRFVETKTLDDVLDEIKRLNANSDKIKAIKLVKETTGWDLKKSKDYVESLLS